MCDQQGNGNRGGDGRTQVALMTVSAPPYFVALEWEVSALAVMTVIWAPQVDQRVFDDDRIVAEFASNDTFESRTCPSQGLGPLCSELLNKLFQALLQTDGVGVVFE